MLTELVTELVRLLHSDRGTGGPFTWQVETNRRGMSSFKGFPHDGPVPSPDGDIVAWMTVLGNLDAELREPDDDRLLVLEVALDADTAEFRHSFELSSISPCSVVLDAEYRYPNHPRPGMPRAQATRPTDPDVLRHVGELVDEFAGHYRRVKGRASQFGEVSTEDELAAAEERLGARLPEDVRALYRLVGEDRYEIGLLGWYSLVPLRSVAAADFGQDSLFGLNRVVFEAYPPGVVRRLSRNDLWVAIATDRGGNSCAVDLDPAAGGRRGQLIEYGRDFHGPVGLVADSVTELLTEVLEVLRRGDIDSDYKDSDHIGARPRRRSPVDYVAAERVGDRDLASVLAGLPDIDHVQQLYLNDADALDLRALSATPRVRELSINRAGRVNLSLPDTVEALSLHAQQADLSAVSGHPALWDLTVQGFPVRVEQLAALPALTRLDASGADIDDPAALADLDLRVLALNTEQWTQLRTAGRLPKRLAGAQWTGHTPLAEAAEWADWLRTGFTSS